MAKNVDIQNMDEADDLIDLGHECDTPTTPEGETPEPKVIYPTIHVELDEPVDFPEGEFALVCVGRLDRETLEHPDKGEDKTGKYCYDLSLRAMKPVGSVEEAEEEAEAGVPQVDSAADLEEKLTGKKPSD